ncbi:MAG: M1 family metallopeptidase [Acidobacteria bacterium]|nr:M1 family metallopeptidase [Acidobacteriota bacterium]
MRYRSTLVLAALFLAAPVGAEAPAPTPPELRLPAVARPLAVAADLTLIPDRETFDGRVEMRIELAQPADFLWLNANRLEVDAAEVVAGGSKVAARVVPGGDQFVGLAFERELPAGEATLTLRYRGRLDAVETEGLFRQKAGDDWYVFSQFESIFARRAFPCFDEPSYRAPWRLTLHVPSAVSAVSNMAVVAERPEADGMKAVEFAETPPIPSYLVALGVGPFDYVDGGSWGVRRTPVRIVVPRGRGSMARFAAEVTGPILAELEKYFGIPYAFGKLDYLVIPHTVGFGAMENPGLVTYTERGILMDEEGATLARRRSYASTTAHENAHMWFGDYVTMAWWDDIWLNEGFATWMSGKTLAAWRPEWWDEADGFGRRGWAFLADSQSTARPVRRPIATTDDIESAFDGISYAKGGALLQMYESWLGADRFRDAVRSYLGAHALGNATSDDFLAAVGGVGGKDVAKSFAAFLDQPGVPVVTFDVACPKGAPARLELAQRRYAPIGSTLSADATWTVPVAATVGRGEERAEVRTLLAERSGALELPFCPDWVAGNRDGAGYYVGEYAGDLLARVQGAIGTLPVGEQVALLSDASMLVSAGALEPAKALGLLPRFAGSPHRQVVESATRIAGSVNGNLVEESLRPNYQRFVQGLLGARARELGLAPKPGEGQDDALLRSDLVALVADEGADPELVAEASRLARRWLEEPSAVDASMLSTVLVIAAQNGNAALFDAYLAKLEESSDRRVRGALFRALGAFRDPGLARRALDLTLSGKFDLREANGILRGVAGDAATRRVAFDWIVANYDRLAPQLPEAWRGGLAMMASGLCDAAAREETRAFFEPRLQGVAQGPIRLEQTLDSIDRCIARRQAQLGKVSEFLRAY